MKAAAALAIALALAAPAAQAATANVSSPDEALVSARRLYNEGRYFQASRYAFLAGASDRLRGEAYSLITVSLVHAGLYQSAAYFFIRTLQEGDQIAVRRALTVTEALFRHVDGDLFRRYLIRRTQPGDYDASNRSAFAYAVGKEALLRGDEAAAVRQLDSVSHSSPLWPFSLQIRATAKAILGDSNGALHDFEECASRADSTANRDGGDDQWLARAKAEASDLKARCQAGVARSLYEQGRFRDADKAYDEIPKASFVWTDILFEQAWNAYAEREYNRTLGKLVTYKSPGLSFVFNPEVDVLTAQAYLALCLYGDANQVINAFNGKYEKVGKDVKRFVDTTGLNLLPYYEAGKKAMKGRLHQAGDFDRLMNRFVRAPYFRRLVDAEESLPTEQAAIRHFATFTQGVSRDLNNGFPGFLEQVVKWRRKTILALGGAFVRNSLLDYHAELIGNFEKMAFIKLEMLNRAKEKLLYQKPGLAERSRGNVEPVRRGDQYYWSFNGEFWNDEIGDYVFGLESECGT